MRDLLLFNRITMVARMNPFAVYLIVAAVLCFSDGYLQTAGAQPEPVTGNIFNPIGEPAIRLQDPWIFTDAKKYFLFGTTSPSQGFQCYESPDLVHWKLDGWAWRMSGLHVARGELRWPQVFQYQGMYCMVYSARTPSGIRLGLAASVSPQGPYHDLHVPWLTLSEGSTAGRVFVDDNGKACLTYSQRSSPSEASLIIYGVALNQDLSKSVGQPVKLLTADQRWEAAGKAQPRSLEAAGIFRIGSKYYLTYSATDPRTAESGVGFATADKPLGPWSKNPDNPLLSTRPESGVAQPSQTSVFRSLDRKTWFIAYQTLADKVNGSPAQTVNVDQLVLEGIRQLSVKASPRRSPVAASAAK